MSNALGLLAFVVYVVAIVGVAAGMTWLVVRLTPSSKPDDPALAKGVNVVGGKLTYEAVAEAHGLDYTPLTGVL